MGKFRIVIDIDKELYKAGQEVRGVWEVEVTEPVTIKGITTRLCGETFVKWTEVNFGRRADDVFMGREYYTKQELDLKEAGELPPGTHKFPFSFTFPEDKMPSSFEGTDGVIRYWLDINIGRPFPWSDVYRHKGLTFLDEVEINYPMYAKPYSGTRTKHISKLLGVGDAGELKLTAQIHRRAFCPGEKILITAKAINNSTKTLGKLMATLTQSVRYIGNGKTKTVDLCVNTVSGNSNLSPNKAVTWNGQEMSIDAIPPSTRVRSSHCLVVSYYVRIFVEIPMLKGGDLGIRFPVTIGTIPQGYKKEQPGASAHVLDLSNAITYTKCNRGWYNFNEITSGNIVSMVYTPMCAYVPNYRYVKPSSQSQRTTTQTPVSVKPQQPSTITSNQNENSQNPKPPNARKDIQGDNAPKQPKAVTVPSNQTQPVKTQAYQTPSPPKQPKAVTVPSNQTQPVKTQAYQTPSPPQTRTEGATVSTTSQSKVCPSAPPMSRKGEDESDEFDILPDDVPPSYDDLFGADVEENVSQDDDLVEKGFFMLIRLPNDRKPEFMKTMKENRGSLQKFRGRLSAVQSKELFRKGTWPENKALAIVSFTTKEMACEWLKSTPVVSNENWLESCDIILVESDELFQESHRSLTLSVSTKLLSFNPDDQKKLVSILNTHLKPARLAVGGITLSSAKTNAEILRGTWETSSSYVSLSLFRKSQDMSTYKKSVDPEINQEFERLRNILYETVQLVVINLEDLNLWYEDEE